MQKEIRLLGIADTPAIQQQGLQFVRTMEPNTGMLFRFDNNRVLNFWMLNTYVPLDIGFMAGGRLVRKERMIPLSRRTISSGSPCSMALETRAGDLSDVPIGARLELSPDGKIATLKDGEDDRS